MSSQSYITVDSRRYHVFPPVMLHNHETIYICGYRWMFNVLKLLGTETVFKDKDACDDCSHKSFPKCDCYGGNYAKST